MSHMKSNASSVVGIGKKNSPGSVVHVSAMCLTSLSALLVVCFVILNWYHVLPSLSSSSSFTSSSLSLSSSPSASTLRSPSPLPLPITTNILAGLSLHKSGSPSSEFLPHTQTTMLRFAKTTSKNSTIIHEVGNSNSNSNSNVNNEKISTATKKKTIAYAITVTKDGPFVDGALVLGYSAMKVHNKSKGFVSEYDCELIAFVVPTVVSSRQILQKFGWRIIEKDLPVPLADIQNQDYAMKMKDSGCCGANEFLKLWAYTLTEYHRVVHLDMDSIVYQNMDELYSMDKELLFTGDWNMKAGSPVPPVQGGFLVVRPSLERFQEFQAIIRKGDHGLTGSGWAGSGIGSFWGGQTIQGILPYFYHVLHHGDGLELNRCVYNCMVDNPYRPYADDGPTKPRLCLNKQPKCEDCRLQKPENVKSAHFTICQKPWTCTEHTNARNKVLCEALHEKWFQLRDEFEKELHIDPSYRVFKNNRFKKSLGMCRRYGDKAYIPIPYDKAQLPAPTKT